MPRETQGEDHGPPLDKQGKPIAHIGVAVQHSPFLFPIVPGAPFVIVEDPRRETLAVFPLTLLSVNHQKMTFKCRCQDPTCTRRVTFKAKWEGRHPNKQG